MRRPDAKTLLLLGAGSLVLAACGEVSQEDVDAQVAAAVDAALADAQEQFEKDLESGIAEALADAEEAAATEERDQLAAAQDAFSAAAEACDLGDWSINVTIDEGGMTLDGEGEDDYGITYSESFCILDELDAPESLVKRMKNTNSLMGLLEGNWGPYHAEWTYHPNNGFDIWITVEE